MSSGRILYAKTHFLLNREGRPKREDRARINEFQTILNEDPVLTIAKKYPKRIKLTPSENAILVRLEKELRAPARIELDGIWYVRTCTWDSKAAETLVRHNLEKMIREVREIGKKALREKNRELLLDMCLDPMSGVMRGNFLDTHNNSMQGDGRAVQELIKQFFKDVEFMKKLKGQIKKEFEEEKKKEASAAS